MTLVPVCAGHVAVGAGPSAAEGAGTDAPTGSRDERHGVEAASTHGPAFAGAAALYGLYHVGYGMGPTEIGFLFGLGAVCAVAFARARNLLVLWPLLTQ